MMGFFGKKKKHPDTHQSKSNGQTSTAFSQSANNTPTSPQPTKPLLKTLPYPSKSVRFASAVSDDEGGFMTDSELEISRSARYGSLRVRPSATHVPKSGFIDRSAVSRSQSYDQGRAHSYSERQQHIQPSGTGNSLWNSNGVSHYQNGTSVDDDYMSDSSTASSFLRGSKMRASLPILRSVNTRPCGLVFLTYQNETKKTVLPAEIKNLDTIKALFLRNFPTQLTPDLLNSPKRRFYILDRPSNKFFLLVHLQEVRDGTMLKLVDSDALTPSIARRSRSAHSALSNDSHYYSEPEFDIESNRAYGQRPLNRMSLTKETNIDEPINNTWSYPAMQTSQIAPSTTAQAIYLNTTPGAQSIDRLAPSSHMASSQSLMNSTTTQASYIPPQPVLHSTIQQTNSVKHNPSSASGMESDLETASISSKDSTASRNRMAKMESQIANLTAWVQTALSRPSSAASDRISEVSYSNRSSISGASSCTPQPEVSIELQKKISKASEQVKDLKTDFKQLRRIHEAQSETIQDTIKDAMLKIQSVVNNIPGANSGPLRAQRQSVDISLDEYNQEHDSVLAQLSELEACVSELRGDVLSKRCHVNMAEVEALALRLSKATRCAANVKSKFPRLAKDIRAVSQGEMDNVINQQEFLSKEPEKIEDALRRCKTVTNVLFTLKRLAAVDGHRTAVVPKLQTKPVEESTRKRLMQDIQSITPNHSDRIKSIQNAEKSLTRRKDILLSKDVLKFEKSLELASKNIKDAENIPKADADSNGLNNLVKRAQQQGHTHAPVANGINSLITESKALNGDHHSNKGVVRRNRPQKKEQTLPFIQNRDSIHWGAESDSDDGQEPNGKFVDVTESSISAFTIVNRMPTSNTQNMNGNSNGTDHLNGLRDSVDSWKSAITSNGIHEKQTIPNGKVYTSPTAVPSPEEGRHKDLQEQCQKLQELQRTHRLTPTMHSTTRAPANTPITTPTSNNVNNSFTTPTSCRGPSSNGKPTIAPKPQMLSSKLVPQVRQRNTEQDYNSSTDSDSESQQVTEPKSTTV